MLENLYIKNFVLIDELNIDFANNFSAFTGETGAGKSIFIDCIACLLGDKLTTSFIRKGCQKAIIEGNFSVNEDIKEKLQTAGYDDDCLIVTREINVDGKSVTRLNHRSATVSFVRNLLTTYVDISTQHENTFLLNEKNHLDLLDKFGQNDSLLLEVNDKYKEYHNLLKRKNELLNTTYNEAQLDVIRYQLEELERLNIVDNNEDEEIQGKLKAYQEIEKSKKLVERIKVLFDDEGILDKLYEFSKLSRQFENIEQISESIQNINNSYYSLQDDYANLIDKIDMFDQDEESINELNSRLFQLQNAKRKYGTSLSGLIEKKDELQNQIDEFSNKEFTLSQIEKALLKALNEYNTIADKLTTLRKKQATELSKAVIEQLKDLALENAKFECQFNEANPSSLGNETVVFMVSMNKGQPLQPLTKVASGGELSRLMLGLKVIFAKLQKTELIIFDEIDTGVSGKVALKIGQKMAALGKQMQVFSITHLPSVAACANNQYLISKQQLQDSTNSTVKLLDENSRIETIAILSSSDVTATSLAAAKELYTNAQTLCK